jgi:hypothetical protein
VVGGVGDIAEGSRGHTLLYDRDMLLSGNHLGQQLDGSSGRQSVRVLGVVSHLVGLGVD